MTCRLVDLSALAGLAFKKAVQLAYFGEAVRALVR